MIYLWESFDCVVEFLIQQGDPFLYSEVRK